jgi:hypothetical protein
MVFPPRPADDLTHQILPIPDSPADGGRESRDPAGGSARLSRALRTACNPGHSRAGRRPGYVYVSPAWREFPHMPL